MLKGGGLWHWKVGTRIFSILSEGRIFLHFCKEMNSIFSTVKGGDQTKLAIAHQMPTLLVKNERSLRTGWSDSVMIMKLVIFM